jgi:excisionase family DNA binding protein
LDLFVLDTEEVAQILDQTPQDVTGLARRGTLRARRMGTHWRFRRCDVMAYLKGRSQIDKSI